MSIVDPRGIAPYRIEWTHDLATQYMNHGTSDTHENAIEAAEQIARERGGFCRVVVQYIIHKTDR